MDASRNVSYLQNSTHPSRYTEAQIIDRAIQAITTTGQFQTALMSGTDLTTYDRQLMMMLLTMMLLINKFKAIPLLINKFESNVVDYWCLTFL